MRLTEKKLRQIIREELMESGDFTRFYPELDADEEDREAGTDGAPDTPSNTQRDRSKPKSPEKQPAIVIVQRVENWNNTPFHQRYELTVLTRRVSTRAPYLQRREPPARYRDAELVGNLADLDLDDFRRIYAQYKILFGVGGQFRAWDTYREDVGPTERNRYGKAPTEQEFLDWAKRQLKKVEELRRRWEDSSASYTIVVEKPPPGKKFVVVEWRGGDLRRWSPDEWRNSELAIIDTADGETIEVVKDFAGKPGLEETLRSIYEKNVIRDLRGGATLAPHVPPSPSFGEFFNWVEWHITDLRNAARDLEQRQAQANRARERRRARQRQRG